MLHHQMEMLKQILRFLNPFSKSHDDQSHE
jgi:hypothetical protein